MDLDGLHARSGRASATARIETVAIDTPEPSPFSHEILNANPYAYLDDAPLEERRARAVQLRRTLRTDFAEGAGALDPAAIAQVAAEAWPPMRDADELHEALLRAHALAVPRQRSSRRSCRRWWRPAAPPRSRVDGRDSGCPPSGSTWRGASIHRPLSQPPIAAPSGMRAHPGIAEACAAEILRGWFECSGPRRASDLARDLAMPRDLVDQALAATRSRRPDSARPFSLRRGRRDRNGATAACWPASTA